MLLGSICLLMIGVLGFWSDSDTINIDLASHMPYIIKNIFEDQGNPEIEAKLIAQSYLAKREVFNLKKLKNVIFTGDLFKYAEEWKRELFYEIFQTESKDILRDIHYIPFSYEYYQAIKTSFHTWMSQQPTEEEYQNIETSHAESIECPILLNFPYTF
ncbi:unnamed protein product [Blepharisma stoltei]|uniref:Uncharacterized protein n=1 Tax=Blepharisma stoltei TaxID=1481888 RepID=A0AAU9J6U3_9CILI|nr:unnamed protein product [Blepharisma stoltei]